MKKKLEAFKSFISDKPLNVIIWKMFSKTFKGKIPHFDSWTTFVKNKSGLEIGVNFSNETIWEGELEQGNNYLYGGKRGFQYIAEGSDLSQIEDNSYDFILSCNNLEHIANPIKTLIEWKRVIKKGGSIILILPRKESNFDHKRPVTSFDHLVNDLQNNTGEDDLSHLKEILELHDLRRDCHAGKSANFQKRSEHNFTNRSLHHHVFDTTLLEKMINYIGMEVVILHSSPTDHFIAASKKEY